MGFPMGIGILCLFVCLSVCLSLCVLVCLSTSISPELYVQSSPYFVYTAMARSSLWHVSLYFRFMNDVMHVHNGQE